MGEQRRGTKAGLQTAVEKVIKIQEEERAEGNTLEERGADVAMTLSGEYGKSSSVVAKTIVS